MTAFSKTAERPRTPEWPGCAYAGSTRAENVRLLIDETWVDNKGSRHVQQEIFDEVFRIVDEAKQFILLDFFLVNDFRYTPGPGLRPISQELTDRLLAKRKSNPDVGIIFITDPINTAYGSIKSPQFEALEQAGVQVVWTDLDQMRDSNPVHSKPWRWLVKPWGIGPGRAIRNPLGEGRISLRSLLKLLNFKANHRKVIVTEKSLLIASANPHSASSAHCNAALRIDGAGTALALEAESAVLSFSGAEEIASLMAVDSGDAVPPDEHNLQLLTERRIKDKVQALLVNAGCGDRVDLSMFYLSDKDVVKAFVDAGARGCNVRIILDPSKGDFGHVKKGIPNRQTAATLVKAGIPLRWADTHGEQFHTKMLYVEHADQSATLLLGSCNYTRRNMNNFNAEIDLAFTASVDEANMQRVRNVFDRWWSNPGGRTYTTGYPTFRDPSRWRCFKAWWQESTGMGTF